MVKVGGKTPNKMTKTTPMPPPKKTIAWKHYRPLADDLSKSHLAILRLCPF